MKKLFPAYSVRPVFLVLSAVLLTGFFACHSKDTLFYQVGSGHSGIDFNNAITEDDSINPLDMEFLYNGGGVGVGDFNRDGLPDLYFTAGMVSNKLYLNKGKLQFQDITEEAGVGGEGRWCNGVSVVDINQDGWPDIYVCTSIRKDPSKRKNLLYINQGLDKNGVPVFKEMAAEYGLADTSFSVQAVFFDYDNDGDLDMYLATTKLVKREESRFFGSNGSKEDSTDVDKLYRNDWDPVLKHPVFTDVSKSAGITQHGFGLGVSVVDINRDGWKDIYVTNDFFGSDLLYINNGDGTFTDHVRDYFRHTSQNAMGNDIADINNDGLADVLAVDMDPEDNYRKKKNLSPSSYYTYQSEVYGSMMLQYVRNTLQLNMGPRVNGNDSIGDPIFGEIGLYSGVAQTDWSWNASIADLDNDGWRDIVITNGYPKDVTDHDFGTYRHEKPNAPKQELIDMIPQIKIPNYAFRNKDGLKFDNVTKQWGLDEPSFSSGAVYVDLDNDGDLDYVVNNINGKAFVYENNTYPAKATAVHWLGVKLDGKQPNRDGFGAWVEIYYGKGQQQVLENNPCRGYLSCVDTRLHFGLGAINELDSLVVKWQGGKQQVLRHVAVDRVLALHESEADQPFKWSKGGMDTTALVTDVTVLSGIRYHHQQADYVDFDKERLLPHKLSEYGPGICAGDVNGDGLEDLFIGGGGDYPGMFLLQGSDGHWTEQELPMLTGRDARRPMSDGDLLFDADGDGDLDLYCSSGGNQFAANTKNYQDRLFLNDGKGHFSWDSAALPVNYTSKSCVKAGDFNHDGKPDLFVGGRVEPGRYPLPVNSFIYRNDSRPGEVHFTDVTDEVAPDLRKLGLVTDATWTDFDNDGWTDLVVVGEWMAITFLRNDHGHFVNVTAASGVAGQVGWWNSIVAADIDHDGDTDFIVGNLGRNSFFQASETQPVSIYADDFDHNGTLDPVTTLFLPDEAGQMKEFPANSRDEMTRQLPVLRKKFPTYKDFGKADIHAIFSAAELDSAYARHATEFSSCYLENLGGGKFKLHPLPAEAQLAPVYGIVATDLNGDGKLDLALSGNDYGTDVTNGRYDAFTGLVLLGDGKGGFKPLSLLQSGLFIPGNARGLVTLKDKQGRTLLAAAQNRGPLKLFRVRGSRQSK